MSARTSARTRDRPHPLLVRCKVDVYVDLHSGPCQRFEAAVGSTVDEMLGAGEIPLAYHPIAAPDALSTTRYSWRARGGGYQCVSTVIVSAASSRSSFGSTTNTVTAASAGLTGPSTSLLPRTGTATPSWRNPKQMPWRTSG